MSAMTKRFQRMRWSLTRTIIDAMPKGSTRSFPASEYYNVVTSVQRLTDAYEGKRQLVLSGGRKRPSVKRIK